MMTTMPVADGGDFLGDSALQDRISAFGDSGELPERWTPEHVTARMIAAFGCLSRASVISGPRQFGNSWPTTLTADERQDAASFKEARMEFFARKERPSAYELSLMDEALEWPRAFLRGSPKMADAFNLYCLCMAANWEIEARLRLRVKRFKERVAPVIRANNFHRDAIIKDVAGRTARRVSRARGDEAKIALIREEGAAEVLRRIGQKGGLPVEIKPSKAEPDRVFSYQALTKGRKEAAALIAVFLNRRKVDVR